MHFWKFYYLCAGNRNIRTKGYLFMTAKRYLHIFDYILNGRELGCKYWSIKHIGQCHQYARGGVLLSHSLTSGRRKGTILRGCTPPWATAWTHHQGLMVITTYHDKVQVAQSLPTNTYENGLTWIPCRENETTETRQDMQVCCAWEQHQKETSPYIWT